jgi:hypothetical protein
MKRILVGLAFCAAASPAFAEDGGVVGKLVTPNGTSDKRLSGRRFWQNRVRPRAGLDFRDRLHRNLYGERAASKYTFAPANEPSATANFSIKPTTTPNTNLGAIQVAPGVKF